MNGSIFSGNLFPYLKDNPLKLLTITLTMCGLALLPWQKDLAKQFIYALELLALFYFFRNIKTLPPVSRMEKIFFIVIVANFLWIAFTFYINGSPGNGSNLVWSRQFFMLMLIPLYYWFRHLKLPFVVIWIAFVAAISFNFMVSLHDLDPNVRGIYSTRARGAMHPIFFGYQNLTMVVFLFFSAFIFKSTYLKLVSLIVAFIGCLIIIWTQSRGVWIAIPLIPAIVIFYGTRQWSYLNRLILVGISILFIASSYFHPTVNQRVDLAITNIEKYIASENANDLERRTSVGARFEMWKAGWQLFLDNPITGAGLGGYQESVKPIAEQHNISPTVGRYKHPHSQYLSALATSGLPGLILLIGLIIPPIIIGHKKRHSANHSARLASYILIIVPLLFAAFSLSDIPFGAKPSILLYTILLAHSMALVAEDKSTRNPL